MSYEAKIFRKYLKAIKWWKFKEDLRTLIPNLCWIWLERSRRKSNILLLLHLMLPFHPKLHSILRSRIANHPEKVLWKILEPYFKYFLFYLEMFFCVFWNVSIWRRIKDCVLVKDSKNRKSESKGDQYIDVTNHFSQR